MVPTDYTVSRRRGGKSYERAEAIVEDTREGLITAGIVADRCDPRSRGPHCLEEVVDTDSAAAFVVFVFTAATEQNPWVASL